MRALRPLKADAPLIVDPDAVLSRTITSELLYNSALRCRWQDGAKGTDAEGEPESDEKAPHSTLAIERVWFSAKAAAQKPVFGAL